MEKSSRAVYVSLALGLVYTLIFMYMMSCCAPLIAYFSIFLTEVSQIACIAGLAYSGYKHPHHATGYYIGAGGAALAFLLFNVLLCCFWNKVQVAIAVIDATADFLVATKRLVLVSIFYFFVAILYLVFWSVAAVGVVSLNEIKSNPNAAGGKEIVWTS